MKIEVHHTNDTSIAELITLHSATIKHIPTCPIPKKKMKKQLYITVLLIALAAFTRAQSVDILRKQVQQIVATKNAVVGVQIIGNNDKDTLTRFARVLFSDACGIVPASICLSSVPVQTRL